MSRSLPTAFLALAGMLTLVGVARGETSLCGGAAANHLHRAPLRDSTRTWASGGLWQLRPDSLGRMDGARPSREALPLGADSLELAEPAASAARPDRVGQSGALWGTDGLVLATARAGNKLYVAGNFNWVGPNTGALVAMPMEDATPSPRFPRVAGEVRAIASDGRGGWFIGGVFNAVEGQYRHNLAHILADGEVSRWDPQANGADVNAIAVDNGVVYVGGGFTTIGSKGRRYIAAIDAGTGLPTPWDPWSSGGITSLAVHRRTIFVGGAFDSIGGAHRENLAAIDAVTGKATAWRMDAVTQVDALLLSGNTLYVGGRFNWIGGRSRGHLAAVDIEADTLLTFDPNGNGRNSMYLPTPTVSALALDHGVLYAAGLFTTMGGAPRYGLAALDPVTAATTDWNPGEDGAWVRAVCVSDSVVYAGGYFDQIGGKARLGIGAISKRTGLATPWNPSSNGPVKVLTACRGMIYAGGYFSSVGPQLRRKGLAQFDLTTGAATPWNPNPVGRVVTAVAVHDGSVYAGGDFENIGGQPRAGIAEVDTLTGAAAGWNPGANGPIEAIVLKDSVLYIGGEFTAVGGVERSNLAAVDARTGTVSEWNPGCNGAVYALARSGNSLYAGGYFSRMGGPGPAGTPRGNLAAFDLSSGALSSWNPMADVWVNAVAPMGHTVYVCGAFNHAGWRGRNGVAGLDSATGLATPWNPDADAEVKAIAAIGGHVYVGGYFQHIGGQPRNFFAALDVVNGVATDWNPHADGAVWNLHAIGTMVFAGGEFSSIEGLPWSALATVQDTSQFVVPPAITGIDGGADRPGLTMKAPLPSPARTIAHVSFSLPTRQAVNLAVFDLQGRCVEILMSRTELPPGDHTATLHAERLGPGCYFCRLEAGGVTISRKLVVLR